MKFKWARDIALLFFVVSIIAGCGGGSSSNSDEEVKQQLIVTIDGPNSVDEEDGFTLVASVNQSSEGLTFTWFNQDSLLVGEGAQLNIESLDVKEDSDLTYVLYVFDGESEIRTEYTLTVKHRINVATAPKDTTNTVLLLQNKLLLEAQSLSNLLIQKNSGEVITQETVCPNGGLNTLTYLDNDDSETVSQGDRLKQTFQDCLVSYQTILVGTRLVSINDVDEQSKSIDFTVNNDAVDIVDMNSNYSGFMSFKGSYSTQLSYSPSSRNITIVADENLHATSLKETYHNDEVYNINIKNLLIDKNIDFNTATYSISTNGKVFDSNLNGEFSFSQDEPWFGYFLEYPHKGSMKVESQKEFLLLESNFVTDSEQFLVKYDLEEFALYWDYFSVDGLASFDENNHITSFRVDNFQHIYDNDLGQKLVPVDGPITFTFSRAVQSATAFFQKEYDYSTGNLPARVEIAGAKINIYPESFLEAGSNYSLNISEIVSVTGQNLSWINADISTTDSIIPKLTSDNYFYQDDVYPTLSAQESILNNGESFSYKWVDVSSLGIEFDDDEAVSTSFSLPQNIESDLIVELIITNELGEVARERITLKYLPKSGTYLYISGEEGDYISSGKKIIETLNTGDFSTSFDGEDMSHLAFSFENNISFWNLDLKAPGNERLSVAKYSNATRYPFQDSSSPGLSFTGEHRGCNEVYGEFEVFELEENTEEVQKLAVNFTQRCESNDSPELKGYIRFNSQIPLNP